jgi:glycosyl transferase family 17
VTVYDTFMLRDELDLLQCRLEELDSAVDWFVVVEASVTHGGRQHKPYHLKENWARFSPWHGKIRYVAVEDHEMPAGDDPWLREHAQREYAYRGILGAHSNDVILHGDIDEIPSAAAVRAASARTGIWTFEQRMTHYAVDWLDPSPWPGTVAALNCMIRGMQWLRGSRESWPRIPAAGWHLSNLGTAAEQEQHVRFGCHMQDAVAEGAYGHIASGRYHREGWHQGRTKLVPVEVDSSWPRYVYERRCPASWFRPKESS